MAHEYSIVSPWSVDLLFRRGLVAPIIAAVVQ